MARRPNHTREHLLCVVGGIDAQEGTEILHSPEQRSARTGAAPSARADPRRPASPLIRASKKEQPCDLADAGGRRQDRLTASPVPSEQIETFFETYDRLTGKSFRPIGRRGERVARRLLEEARTRS